MAPGGTLLSRDSPHLDHSKFRAGYRLTSRLDELFQKRREAGIQGVTRHSVHKAKFEHFYTMHKVELYIFKDLLIHYLLHRLLSVIFCTLSLSKPKLFFHQKAPGHVTGYSEVDVLAFLSHS